MVQVDSDDEDLKAAIALSLQEMSPNHQIPQQGKGHEQDFHQQTAVAPSLDRQQSYGISGLDRRADEAARLDRLKRKRGKEEISPPPVSRNVRTMSKLDNAALGGSENFAVPSVEPTSASTRDAENIYYDGIVKKTWVFGYSRSQDIKIEEIFQKNELQAAVLSSFMWDMDWLFSKLNTNRTKFVLVMQAKDSETQQQYRAETAAVKNLRLCFPPMPGQVNCMHSKLMLLFFEHRLRVAVPTANLTRYDWGETGVMENSVFIIDLPKLSEDQQPVETSFSKSMLHFAQAMGLQNDVVEKLKLFDFSKTRNLGFVHSIGGVHEEQEWMRTGLCGLGMSIQQLGLRTRRPLNVDFVASSIGSLTDDFLRSLYLAAQGDNGLAAYTYRNPKQPLANVDDERWFRIGRDESQQWTNRFKAYFPTQDTVESSKGGADSAGTICFQKHWWNKPDFPRHIMKDCISRRDRLLMHNKVSKQIHSFRGFNLDSLR
ncbi:MAG: hypothetical protein Q9227_002988 [Pyrenula ochraceoflavens]